MANHVTTRCTVSGPSDAIAEFRALLFEGEGDDFTPFDFNKLVPMPAILREAESSTNAQYGAALILARAGDTKSFFGSGVGIPDIWVGRMREETGVHHMGEVARIYLAAHPEYEVEGMKRLRAVIETGYTDWYPWSNVNWGTKWNAYSVETIDDGEPFVFKFETAWSFPTPVFVALEARFAKLTFDCLTFDEGWNFAGKGQLGAVVADPFTIGEATDELYEAVYGHAPDHEEA